ncbi:class I SAM-dependent methyltransferase [bacterium]|nr:class I SAM-dependent methyltransferase [bacterium]
MTDPAGGPWFATAFGAHYPLLYRHRDADEAARAVALLPTLAPLHEPILDLGCGDGRHLALLAPQRRTLGLDLSPHLLAAATARPDGAPAPLVRGDMRCLPLAAGSCGTVLSLFTAFGYFGPPAAHAAVVAGIARVLAPGGHWFLDYFDGEAVQAELGDGAPHGRERELGPVRVVEVRRYVAATRQVVKDVRLEARPGHEDAARAWGVGPAGLAYAEEVAVFTRAELDDLARAAGLAPAAAAGDYDGRPLGAGSRWILVYRQPERTAR